MKKIIKSALFCFVTSLLLLPFLVSAQNASGTQMLNRLSTIAGNGGYQTDQDVASTPIIVGKVISVFLSFMGVVFIILIIMAGFEWMKAQGNMDEISKAKATMREAIIGLIVALSAYSIWTFIFDNFIS